MNERLSELAQKLRQIDLENEAGQRGLHGVAIVATHESITARMEQRCGQLQALERAGRHEEVRALLMSDALWEPEGIARDNTSAVADGMPGSNTSAMDDRARGNTSPASEQQREGW